MWLTRLNSSKTFRRHEYGEFRIYTYYLLHTYCTYLPRYLVRYLIGTQEAPPTHSRQISILIPSLSLNYFLNGCPNSCPFRHPPRSIDKHYQSPRELLFEILPLSCSLMATAVLRCRWHLKTQEDSIRSAQDCWLCSGKNGRRACQRCAARPYHKSERDENSS